PVKQLWLRRYLDVSALRPPELPEFLRKRRDPGTALHSRSRHQDTYPPHSLRLLRARRERPCRRASEEGDELAPLHSITSSARASSVGGTSTPSARAVGRLMTNSNLLDCTTGRSAGLAPLRILPV